jgi:molecular chaperone GrpE
MPDENQQEENNIEQLKKDLDSAINNWKRALADFENYKKQQAREAEHLLDLIRADTARRFVPVFDALDQALKHAPRDEENRVWSQGLDQMMDKFIQIFQEMGLKKIEAIGKKFDPHFHEAVKEAVGDVEDGVIVDELQSGFILNDKVIRPSQVVISKQKP